MSEEFHPATFGEFLPAIDTLSSRSPEESTDLVLKALSLAGQRGVLASGWGGLRLGAITDSAFVDDDVPHDWLFPRMAAVVHHGGMGTTAAGLRAGVPAVTIPTMLDQRFWGRRVFELGVGPSPIPRAQLSVERLAGAIRAAAYNQRMRERAETLGKRIRSEDGVARAIEAIDAYVGVRPRTNTCIG